MVQRREAGRGAEKAKLRVVTERPGQTSILDLAQGVELYADLLGQSRRLQKLVEDLRLRVLRAMEREGIENFEVDGVTATRQIRHFPPKLDLTKAAEILQREGRLREAEEPRIDPEKAGRILDQLYIQGKLTRAELPYEEAREVEALIVQPTNRGWASEFCACRRARGMPLVWRDEGAAPGMIGRGTRAILGGGRRGVGRKGAGRSRVGGTGGHGNRHHRSIHLLLALATLSSALLLLFAPLLMQTLVDEGPGRVPIIGARRRAQGDQGIDVARCPVHPRPFHPGFDDEFVATLDHATADRITRRLKLGIANLRAAPVQVGKVFVGLLPGRVGALKLPDVLLQSGENPLGLAVAQFPELGL